MLLIYDNRKEYIIYEPYYIYLPIFNYNIIIMILYDMDIFDLYLQKALNILVQQINGLF